MAILFELFRLKNCGNEVTRVVVFSSEAIFDGCHQRIAYKSRYVACVVWWPPEWNAWRNWW